MKAYERTATPPANGAPVASGKIPQSVSLILESARERQEQAVRRIGQRLESVMAIEGGLIVFGINEKSESANFGAVQRIGEKGGAKSLAPVTGGDDKTSEQNGGGWRDSAGAF